MKWLSSVPCTRSQSVLVLGPSPRQDPGGKEDIQRLNRDGRFPWKPINGTSKQSFVVLCTIFKPPLKKYCPCGRTETLPLGTFDTDIWGRLRVCLLSTDLRKLEINDSHPLLQTTIDYGLHLKRKKDFIEECTLNICLKKNIKSFVITLTSTLYQLKAVCRLDYLKSTPTNKSYGPPDSLKPGKSFIYTHR